MRSGAETEAAAPPKYLQQIGGAVGQIQKRETATLLMLCSCFAANSTYRYMHTHTTRIRTHQHAMNDVWWRHISASKLIHQHHHLMKFSADTSLAFCPHNNLYFRAIILFLVNLYDYLKARVAVNTITKQAVDQRATRLLPTGLCASCLLASSRTATGYSCISSRDHPG